MLIVPELNCFTVQFSYLQVSMLQVMLLSFNSLLVLKMIKCCMVSKFKGSKELQECSLPPSQLTCGNFLHSKMGDRNTFRN